ncbi:MAG: hypothetical protein ACRDLP_15715, partial [Solirubrobacteraceae bacterium]
MALVVTPRMLFLHMPKTGGRWVMGAMLAAGVPAVRPEGVPGHGNADEAREFADRFTFAFVRHPLDFWRSYWAFRMRDGWDPESNIDTAIASPDFDTFIAGVIERFPGEAGAVYETFVGTPEREIDFIGRFERLADDLVSALRLAGEEFDEAALRAHPAENVSDYGQLPAFFDRESAARLAECERRAIDRFYYWDPMPERLVRDGLAAPIVSEALAERIAESEIALRDAKAALAVARRGSAAERAVS